MKIAPTGSAAGTAVSEAKLKASAGQVEPVAGAIAVLQANGAQVTSVGSALAVGVATARLAVSSGQAAPINAVGGAASAESLQQNPIGDVANVPAVAAADLLKLAEILQPANLPERTLRVDNLIRETVSAIQQGRIEFAVGRLIEAATADPSRVDEIRSMPALEAISANVEHVVAHLTNIAKMDAETKLTSAEQLFERADSRKLPHWETAPADLLRIGFRLIEAGGYVNYVRTAELATALQSAYWAATDSRLINDTARNFKKEQEALKGNRRRPTTPDLVRRTWGAFREELPRGVRAAWKRAPLLVLFGTWFMVGLTGGVLSKLARIVSPDSWIASASDFGFEIWGLGFLVLVGLGFWAGIRKRCT